MTQQQPPVQIFFVNDTPCAVWNYSDDERAQFLESYQPLYFATIANAITCHFNDEDADDKEKQIYATHLRSVYAHAIEAFVSLTFATLQAPACIEGWLLKYSNQELYSLANAALANTSFWNRFDLTDYGPASMAAAIYRIQEREDLNIIAEWYTYFFREFANSLRQKEYNSIKHGFRASSSPSKIRFTPISNSALALNFESQYGIGFGEVEKVAQGNSLNIFINRGRLNWHPLRLSDSINLISLLIHNNIQLVKVRLGLDAEPTYVLTPDTSPQSLFSDAETRVSYSSTRIRQAIITTPDQLVTRAEVEASYDPPAFNAPDP